MGPAEYQPAFPEFEWLDLPASQRYASRWEQDCNSIQAMEGELDAAHVSFLHRMVADVDQNKQALTGAYFQADTAPRWHVQDTCYGFVAASERNVEDQRSCWRMNQYLLPFYTSITGVAEQARMTRMWVPMDDEHCWVIAVSFRPDASLGEAEMRAWKNGENTHRKVIPGTTRPYETREHLGSSDNAIIAMRKRPMTEARALHERNVAPEVLSDGGLYRVRAHQAVVPRGVVPDPKQAWLDT